MTTSSSLTATQIPCCLCGTMILPNPANQCKTCLAQEVDLQGLLQKGPSGSDCATIYQCRQCRSFQVTEKLFKPMDMESPELLSVCLKNIPALASNANGIKIKLVDAMWIWTEPHSMRLKLRLSVRATIQGVEVQQRVPVELKIQFKQCPTCNREYTNRTWHALVQLRQKRTDDAPRKGLVALEQALARNAQIRKHVLKIDSARNGFDFYFLNLPEAQAFASYLAKVAPLKIKTTKKLVSTDVKNNTANLKYTVSCDLVPLCKHDLIMIHKNARGILSGRMSVVTKVSSVVHLVDANAKRAPTMEGAIMEVPPETYYKSGGEKLYQVVQASHRMIRFVVLDVELCANDNYNHYTGEDDNDNNSQENPKHGPIPYALADVEVARESDFGQNDETFRCVTHLGPHLQTGDVVLGYDLVSSVLSGGAEWDMDHCFQSHFEVPDVVLVKKVKEKTLAKEQQDLALEDEEKATTSNKGKGRKSKRKEKQRLRNEKKMKELEESALRMGFVPEGGEEDYYQDDPDLQADIEEMERNLGAIEHQEVNIPTTTTTTAAAEESTAANSVTTTDTTATSPEQQQQQQQQQ